MKRYLFILLLPFFLMFTPAFSQTTAPLRIGFLGDSSTDEYRGTDNRGGRVYANVTFNWMEQLVRNRNISAGIWGNHGEPRRTGYETNWARSGATTATLLTQRQHLGLAAQVANGQIDLVIVYIGINDFAPWSGGLYTSIYNGTLTGAALQARLDLIVANITTAVDTILTVQTIPIIVSTIGDFDLSPQINNSGAFNDPVKRLRVSTAVQTVNNGILALAQARGLGAFNLAAFSDTILAQVHDGFLVIDGVAINMNSFGDEPHNLILSDNIHDGTILEGLIANGYLGQINKVMGLNIPLFTNSEILQHAGLMSLATNTPSPTPTNTPTSTPLPPTSLPNAAPPLNYFSSSPIVLTWTEVSWAGGYEVQISRNSNFTALIAVPNPLPSASFSYTVPELAGGIYYWRVRAIGPNGTPGSWSAIGQFTVAVSMPTGSAAQALFRTPTPTPTGSGI